MLLSRAFCGEMTPLWRMLPISSRSPQQSPGAAKPEAIQSSKHNEREEASWEQVMLSASHAVAARWWKQSPLEQACFGFGGCNHRWLPEEHDSSGPACVAVALWEMISTCCFPQLSRVMKGDMRSWVVYAILTFRFKTNILKKKRYKKM